MFPLLQATDINPGDRLTALRDEPGTPRLPGTGWFHVGRMSAAVSRPLTRWRFRAGEDTDSDCCDYFRDHVTETVVSRAEPHEL